MAGFIGQLQRQVVKGFWRFMLHEACHHVTACHVLYFYLASPRRDESSHQKDEPFYLYLSKEQMLGDHKTLIQTHCALSLGLRFNNSFHFYLSKKKKS